MAFYAACMLDMALELADEDDSYEELAITYLSFYAGLANAINEPGGTRKKKGLHLVCFITMNLLFSNFF